MLILHWTLFLLGAASAQIQLVQYEQNDVCPFRAQTWKETLEKNQDVSFRCISVVEKNSDRFHQMMSKELTDLEKNSKERDDALVKLTKDNFDGLKETLTQEALSLTNDSKQRDRNLEQRLIENQNELKSAYEEQSSNLSQTISNFQESNQQDLKKMSLDLKERDQNLDQKLTQNQNELKSLLEEKTTSNIPLEVKIQDLDKLEEISNAIREAILQLMKALKEQDKELAEMKVSHDQSLLTASSEIKSLVVKSEEKINQNLVKEIQQLKGQVTDIKSLIQQSEERTSQKILEKLKCGIWKSAVGDVKLSKHGDGYYYFNKTYHRNWTQSVDLCKSKGMHLASVESEEELKLIGATEGYWYWVWASDIGQTPGTFYWQDGRKVDEGWRKNEKNYGAGKETCLALLNGKLQDYLCNTKTGYTICEVSSEFLECV